MGDTRDTFVKSLTSAAQADQRVAAVVNDSVSSSRLSDFGTRFPLQIYNVGIAEQTMVGFAAGLASAGLKPWVCSATCFLSYRALEQIKNDVVYSKQNVKLVGNTSGLDYGPLGATHHALEDLGVLRALPGFPIIIPADHRETAESFQALLNTDGPGYLRLYRSQVPESLGMPGHFQIGKVRVVREGSDCTIFACGAMVIQALEAARLLEKEGISTGVVNVSTIAPFDTEGVVKAAAKSSVAITIEEHSIHGGLGDAVCSALSLYSPMAVLKLGMNGFSITGSPEQLRKHYGLTSEEIFRKVRLFIRRIVA